MKPDSILCFRKGRALQALSLLASAAVIAPVASAQTNQLLRSGSMAEFGDTKIYTGAGVELSVATVDGSYFQQSKELAVALAGAVQAAGVVDGDWQATDRFEEWSDRLILSRTTSFNLLDGGRFNAEFFNRGEPFEPSPNIEIDDSPVPDIMQMAADFIAEGGHLDLYPAARDAGNQGAQALLAEMGRDVGPVTFTETLEFSRALPALDSVDEAAQVFATFATTPAEAGGPLDPLLASYPALGFTDPVRAKGVVPGPPEDRDGGVSVYEQDMLNGFTTGLTYAYSTSLGKPFTYFKATCFATFGIGARIPWKAKVTVEPRYIAASSPDQTPFTSSLSISTLDASSDFYRSVGVPTHQIYGGRELVLEAGIGIAVEFKVLGKTIINRPPSDPLIGGFIDLGMHFDPPLGSTLNIGSPTVPYEVSGLGFTSWSIGVGGDFRAQLAITGHEFALNVAPRNAWGTGLLGSLTKANRTLVITEEDVPKSLGFAVDDASPTSMGLGGVSYYRHGAVYSNAAYRSALNIVPQTRIRATLRLSSISGLLNDINFSTPWLPLVIAQFNVPQLGPYTGTEDTIEAYVLNRRELATVAVGQASHEISFDGAGEWTVAVNLPASGVDELTEFLPGGLPPVPTSIVGGGHYDAIDHSITWVFPDGVPPDEVSYRIQAPAAAAPRPIGHWTPQGQATPIAVLNPGDPDLSGAELALLVNELLQRPTLEEIQDARLGATVIEVGPDQKVRLTLALETTDDLQVWNPAPEADPSPVVVEYDLPAGKRFFRFSAK